MKASKPGFIEPQLATLNLEGIVSKKGDAFTILKAFCPVVVLNSTKKIMNEDADACEKLQLIAVQMTEAQWAALNVLRHRATTLRFGTKYSKDFNTEKAAKRNPPLGSSLSAF